VIVTCPSCASKYRVRDEAVPAGGAELECPSCKAVFIAHPPKRDDPEVAALADKMLRQKEHADQRLHDLESSLQRTLAAKDELSRRLQDKDVDNARVEARAIAAEGSVARLTDELRRQQQRASLGAGDAAELASVKHQLLESQRRERTLAAELEVANSLVSSLQIEMNALRARAPSQSFGRPQEISPIAQQRIDGLTTEILGLRQQLADVGNRGSSSSMSPGIRSLIAAIGPMLWGLDQSVGYLEQFAANEATLAGHVKQLRLLQKVLQRLVDEGAA